MLTDDPAVNARRLDMDLPPGAGGHWCSVRVRVPGRRRGAGWWAQLELVDPARGHIVRTCFLGPARPRGAGQERRSLVHVPALAQTVTLHIFGTGADSATTTVRILSRAGTACRLLWRGRALVARALAGDGRGRFGRLRALLGQAPARAGEAPPYDVWIALCEATLPPPPPVDAWPHQLLMFGSDPAARAASVAAATHQTVPGAAIIAARNADDTKPPPRPWTILLQAGEILAPAAVAWFAHAAGQFPEAAFITADCDELDGAGARVNPLFKPAPDRGLLDAGLYVRGACAVRTGVVGHVQAADADSLRRVLGEALATRVAHVPRILTHIGAAAKPAPARRVLRQRKETYLPRVTALIPSALRSHHVPRCLHCIVGQTAYPNFNVRLVLSDARAASPRLLRRVQRLPRVQLLEVKQQEFNYAAVNNAAAAAIAHAPGDLLLLLNDDVAPINVDWLDQMVAHMQDPSVGIVGARLLYGNGMVQHEGVIMGLANLCEHAGRLRDYRDPGPHGLALLDREVSAVTAACMLIRADLFATLGGMDTAFRIALNDVDLCLRAREAGWRVVYCASAVLHHFESLSLGRHYAGARAALEAVEVHRLRNRWAGAIAADPFYSALASQEPGREWQPGFVTRDTAIAAFPSNPAATL